MRRINSKWMAFTLSYYAANAVWQGYMSLFYRNLGFSSGKIGLINAVMAVSALMAQPVWGMLGDRTRKANRLLALLALLAASLLPAVLLGGGFAVQALLAALFYAFYCALLPMGDSVLLDALNRESLPFGPYRLVGALAFAVSGAVFGWILDRNGTDAVIWVSAGLLLAASASALLLPEDGKKARRKIAFRVLFRNRELMKLLAFMVPVQMTMGYFYTFYAAHFSGMSGANSAMLGMGYALATASELPYLIFCDRIFEKYGAARPMCIAAAILALRWTLLGFTGHAWLALASQLLHGGGFIVMTVSMAKYIAENVDENLRSSGQMLLSMASFGLARVAGNLGGGFLVDHIGGAKVFLIGGGICLASACLFAPSAFRGRHKMSNYCLSVRRTHML